MTNRAIGSALNTSEITIKSDLARISRKLGTGVRSHIVLMAMRAGVLS